MEKLRKFKGKYILMDKEVFFIDDVLSFFKREMDSMVLIKILPDGSRGDGRGAFFPSEESLSKIKIFKDEDEVESFLLLQNL